MPCLDNLLSGRPYRRAWQASATIAPPGRSRRNLDPAEVERFEQLADEWWDPNGKLRPLHSKAPPGSASSATRWSAISTAPANELKPLRGLSILDVGCGGGLVSEPLARLGATSPASIRRSKSIAVARRHAEGQGLAIDYRSATVEELQAAGETLRCRGVHGGDRARARPAAFVRSLGALVRPGGALVLSTLNRTWKSYALAIVAAEYMLGWLPRGTHDWNRFVTPDELGRYLADAGFGAAGAVRHYL